MKDFLIIAKHSATKEIMGIVRTDLNGFVELAEKIALIKEYLNKDWNEVLEATEVEFLEDILPEDFALGLFPDDEIIEDYNKALYLRTIKMKDFDTEQGISIIEQVIKNLGGE